MLPFSPLKNWQEDYKNLIKQIKNTFNNQGEKLTFELISHRYTERAKKIIEQAYPQNKLPMTNKQRKFKYGQFGYGKYIYPKKTMSALEEFFRETINQQLPAAEIKYFV